MDYNTALEILFLEDKNWDLQDLKTSYKALAKKYHPDKNNSENAKEQFQIINESYEYLLKYELNKNKNYYNNNFEFDFDIHNIDNININNIDELINKIIEKCPEKIIKFTNICKKLYNLTNELTQQNQTQSTEQQNQTIPIIKNKDNLFEIIISLENLLENNIYIIDYKNKNYYIPLWYPEIVYDLNDNENIIVNIQTNIPNNIHIEDDNTMNVSIIDTINNIINNNGIDISKYINNNHCNNKELNFIKASDLFIKKTQIIKKENCGLLEIKDDNDTNYLNIKNYSYKDVIFFITISDIN